MISGVSSAFVEGISAAIESDAIESVVRVGAAVVHESVSGSREEEKEDGAIEEVLGEIRVALSSASVVIIPTLREEFSYPTKGLVSSKGDLF